MTGAGRYVHGGQPFAGWEMVCTVAQPSPPSPSHLTLKPFLFSPPKMKHNPLPDLRASSERVQEYFCVCAAAFSLLEKCHPRPHLKRKRGEGREISWSHQCIFISWTISRHCWASAVWEAPVCKRSIETFYLLESLLHPFKTKTPVLNQNATWKLPPRETWQQIFSLKNELSQLFFSFPFRKLLCSCFLSLPLRSV